MLKYHHSGLTVSDLERSLCPKADGSKAPMP
jgi:hypothetical protein